MIKTQTPTFEDPNYVNTIGSKVVITPVSEAWEFSVKKDQLLQRTMVHMGPASASSGEMPDSSDAVFTGDSRRGGIPEATENIAAADLPSGEMPKAEDDADLEDLPSGKRSRTEATKEEEDVEMQECEEQQEEEMPQGDPMDAPDYDAEEPGDSDSESMNSAIMARANELVNSHFYEHIVGEENIPGEPSNLEQRSRMATPQIARFAQKMLGRDLEHIDGLLTAERRLREERADYRAQEEQPRQTLEQMPFLEVEVKEEKPYGEELEKTRRRVSRKQ